MFSRSIRPIINTPNSITSKIIRGFKTGTPTDISFAASAIQKLKLLKQPLRIQVDAGGCHGFQYNFELLDTDDKILENDFVFEKEGTRFVLDDITLDMLKGSSVYYAEELIGSSFQVKNPNAESSCGCKISFNLK